jgi:hypothetical protein
MNTSTRMTEEDIDAIEHRIMNGFEQLYQRLELLRNELHMLRIPVNRKRINRKPRRDAIKPINQ